MIGDQPKGSEQVEDQDLVAAPDSYEFAVYALDQTSRLAVPSGTFFQFDGSDLPFSIGGVCFGNFREDDSFQSIYYGCSGLLMNASGPDAKVTLFEGSGKRIVDILYHGQDPVVIGSEVRYDSYLDETAWTGTDLIVMDWMNGSWTPRQGIYVEHTSNVTFTSARFYVMVFEPSSSTGLPEFPVAIVAVGIAMVIAAVGRRKVR